MKKLALAVVALAAMSGTALAADLTPMVPVIPPAPPAPMAPAFNWSGPYAGVYGGAFFVPGGIVAADTGVAVGANFQGSSALVFGLEAQVGALFVVPGVATVFEADINGRIGFALGAEDRALLYGEGGIGFAGGARFWTAGGGLEFGIGDSTSFFTEAKFAQIFGGGPSGVLVQAGLNWHFGH